MVLARVRPRLLTLARYLRALAERLRRPTPETLAWAAVVFVALVVRVWALDSDPAELHPDEVAGWLGIRDMVTGARPPSVFIDRGVFYLPMYGIFESISVMLFGTGAAAIRLPAALFGVATALVTGALTYELVRSRSAALVAAAIMAILPWDINISRVGCDPASALPFLIGGLALVWRGLRRTSNAAVAGGLVVLALGIYTYRAAGFDGALLLTATVAFGPPRLREVGPGLRAGAVGAGIVLLPMLVTLAFHPGAFGDGPVQATFKDGISGDSVATFWHLYVGHFDIGAVFAQGDGNLQHGPAIGWLYWWMLPFIVLGLVAPRALGRDVRLFAIVWLLIYPLGGSLTNDGRIHFMRTLAGAPLACVLTAAGLRIVWRWSVERLTAREGRFAATALAVVALVQWLGFEREYLGNYRDASAPSFQYGDREIFAFVRAHLAGHDRICFTALDGWNQSALLEFYLPNPGVPIALNLDGDDCMKHRTLYVVRDANEVPFGSEMLGSIQQLDGSARAYVLEN